MFGPLWPGADKAWTFLAPMEGITHPAFRALIAARPGLGVVCTEFVRICSTGLGAKHLREQVIRAPGAALSVQVMGNHIEHMAEATEIVAGAGAGLATIIRRRAFKGTFAVITSLLLPLAAFQAVPAVREQLDPNYKESALPPIGEMYSEIERTPREVQPARSKVTSGIPGLGLPQPATNELP